MMRLREVSKSTCSGRAGAASVGAFSEHYIRLQFCCSIFQ